MADGNLTDCSLCARHSQQLHKAIQLIFCNDLGNGMVMLMLLQMRKLRLRGLNSSAHTMQLVSSGVRLCPLPDSLACTLISHCLPVLGSAPRVTVPFPSLWQAATQA